MKRLNKNAIKRVKSQTYLNYAECKHFGRSQTKGMYALLIAVATMVCITIYESCSADEDYDYYSGNELNTRAEREMGRSGEGNNPSSFPSVTEIINNNKVIKRMNTAWKMTLKAANQSGRQEYGFLIYYDRVTQEYSFSTMYTTDPVICDSTAYVNLPNFNSNCCAFFHTHTSLQYCSSIYSRETGPSDGDIDLANNSGVPGILYDYTIERIRGGMPKDMEHTVYTFGPDRRED